jgi:plasmid stabilization system protein ParE
MIREVRWTDEAEDDLDDIFYFIAFEREHIAAAREVVMEIRSKADT